MKEETVIYLIRSHMRLLDRKVDSQIFYRDCYMLLLYIEIYIEMMRNKRGY